MAPIRILGVDPGLRNMGWGVIEAEGSRLSFVACGTVKSDEKQDMSDRLKHLFEQLSEIVRQYQPDEAAVEETFVNKDARATLKLGQARGIVGIEIAITAIIGKWKVSQNRSEADRAGVVAGLEERQDDEARAMAGLVNEKLQNAMKAKA